MEEGKLITFEGIDGSGKTTLARLTYQELRSKGHKVILTAEPTDTWLGASVKKSFKEDVNPFTEALLFIADHATHVEKIKEWLEQGIIVVSDRYNDSNYAYQGASLRDLLMKFKIDAIEWLIEIQKHFTITPDITFLLDINPQTSLKRISGRDEKTKFEKLKFLEDVRKNYLKLAVAERFKILDGNKSIDELFDEVMKHIALKLQKTL